MFLIEFVFIIKTSSTHMQYHSLNSEGTYYDIGPVYVFLTLARQFGHDDEFFNQGVRQSVPNMCLHGRRMIYCYS
jgi:hypothetical protein